MFELLESCEIAKLEAAIIAAPESHGIRMDAVTTCVFAGCRVGIKVSDDGDYLDLGEGLLRTT